MRSSVLGDTNGQRTEERITGSYRARRDFGKSPIFAFGLLSYERDKFQGIDRRFTQAVGAGYQIFDKDRFEWEVAAGPALRQTVFVDAKDEQLFAALATTKLEWEISDTLTFNQKAELVLDSDTSSFSSTTSLTSKIYGRLSGKISFDVDLESNPPPGNGELDTYSRLSLTYAF
jgi:putative salt-induced outer membrane protein